MVSSAFHSTKAVVRVRVIVRERVELLIELFWEVRENKHLAEMPLPLALFFQFCQIFG